MIRGLIIVIGLFVSLCSCSQSDQITYSCDMEVDGWVKDNLSEIQKMNRTSWMNVASEYSIAVYRAFTPEQKVEFWRDKFQEVKKLSWNEKELSHIIKLESFMFDHTYYFYKAELSENDLDEMELFCYKWQEYAIEQFGWTKQVVGSIAMTGKKVLDTKGGIMRVQGPPPPGGLTPPKKRINVIVM